MTPELLDRWNQARLGKLALSAPHSGDWLYALLLFIWPRQAALTTRWSLRHCMYCTEIFFEPWMVATSFCWCWLIYLQPLTPLTMQFNIIVYRFVVLEVECMTDVDLFSLVECSLFIVEELYSHPLMSLYEMFNKGWPSLIGIQASMMVNDIVQNVVRFYMQCVLLV